MKFISCSLPTCILAVKRPYKTADRFERLKQAREEMSHAPSGMDQSFCYWEQVPLCSRQGYTPQGNLQFYLLDHREDIRKWDGTPTSTLEEQVCELRERISTTWNSSRINAAPVSSGQVLRQNERVEFKEISSSYLQEMSNEFSDKNYRGPVYSQLGERDNWIYWTVYTQWPGTSEYTKSIKL